MEPTEPPTARAVFDHAIGLASSAERQAYVAQACADDAELRRRVENLLRAYDAAGSFLESPAAGLGADVTIDQPTGAPPEAPGAVIGRYKLLQQIGEGGYGVVFMAEQTHPVRRVVALKIIKPGMDTRQVIARFEAERQALALMDHPNIARVFDAGATSTGRPYFVMELVRGVPITSYCDEHHLTPQQRLELFVAVCQAVQHAHQKGIIHRDLKPTNVLVAPHDGAPVPKVIDFGVAKATGPRLTDLTMFTGFGDVIGTLEYMSPEQAELNQLDVDTRSDIYSLGVLLYELLTGSTPLERKRLKSAALVEALRVIREEDPPRPSTRLTTTEQLPTIAANRGLEPKKLSGVVHGELDWIVMKALEKDRNRRYETANGLARDVERYLHDEPVQACPPSARYRFRKFVRRNKAPLVAAGLIALALLLGIVISTWQARRARAAERLARFSLQSETEARQRAVTEVAKASAVSGLLQEMLRSANPDQVKGQDYTVRQLLDDASQRLGDQLKDQPEVEAAVRATIGNAYRRLELPDKAEPHLRAALEIRRRTLGAEHALVAQSLLDHAMLLIEVKQFVRGEALAREALAICQKLRADPSTTLHAYYMIMHALNLQAKQSQAQVVGEEAIAYARQAGVTEHAHLASILHLIVWAPLVAGDLDKAERRAREAVAMHRRMHGEAHPETGWGVHWLGIVLADGRHQYAEAETCYREALAIFRRGFPEDHRNVVNSRGRLEGVLRARGDEAGLAALRAEAAARMNQALARGADTAKLRLRMARLISDGGDLDGAIALCSEVIATEPARAEAWGLRGEFRIRKDELFNAINDYTEAIRLDPTSSWFWHERGYAHFRLGHHPASVADHTRSIELGDTDAGQRLRRGQSYQAVGEPRKALEDFSRAAELNPQHWENWQARGEAHLELGEREEADRDFARARQAAPDYDMQLGHRLHGRAVLLHHGGKLAEAEKTYREALTLKQRAVAAFVHQPDYRLDLASTHVGLAAVLRDAKQNAAAATIEAEGLAIMEKLTAEFPGNARYQDQLAHDYNMIAWHAVLHPNPNPADARIAVQRSIKSVEMRPTAGHFWNTLGAAHLRAGDDRAALAAFDKSMSFRRGGTSHDWFFMSIAYARLGDRVAARKWYDRGVESMEKYQSQNIPMDQQLTGFRTEAEQMLRISPSTRPG